MIGIYQKPQNIFEPPGQQIRRHRSRSDSAKRNFRYDETNGLFISVKPRVPRWT